MPELEGVDHYVYVYMDPTKDNEVFYVGKGTGNRIDHHEAQSSRFWKNVELEEDESEANASQKLQRLRDIHDAREQPIKLIVGRYHTANEAFAVESTLIHWVYGHANLTNVACGHNHLTIRERGNLKRFVENLEVKPVPAQPGDYEEGLRDGYERFDIENKLGTLKIALLKEGYEFSIGPERAGQDAFIGLPVRWDGDINFVFLRACMRITRRAFVRVDLHLCRSTEENRMRLFSLLKEKASTSSPPPFELMAVRGWEQRNAGEHVTEPKLFSNPEWNRSLLDAEHQIGEIIARLEWLRDNLDLDIDRLCAHPQL